MTECPKESITKDLRFALFVPPQQPGVNNKLLETIFYLTHSPILSRLDPARATGPRPSQARMRHPIAGALCMKPHDVPRCSLSRGTYAVPATEFLNEDIW